MKKTIFIASALFAMLFTTVLTGQTTRPGSGTGTGAGTTTGSGSGSGAVGGSGSGTVGGAGTTNPVTGTGNQGMRSYPKVYVSTPSPTKGGKPSRKLLVTNPFKGKDQGIDLSFDIVDSKGNPVPGSNALITKDDLGDMTIDAGKLKSKTGNRLRIKGAGSAVEFYPF